MLDVYKQHFFLLHRGFYCCKYYQKAEKGLTEDLKQSQ